MRLPLLTLYGLLLIAGGEVRADEEGEDPGLRLQPRRLPLHLPSPGRSSPRIPRQTGFKVSYFSLLVVDLSVVFNVQFASLNCTIYSYCEFEFKFLTTFFPVGFFLSRNFFIFVSGSLPLSMSH